MSQCTTDNTTTLNDMMSTRPNSNGLKSILDAMKIRACESIQGGVVSILPPGGGGFNSTFGCEKLAVMASTIDQHMEAIQCLLVTNTQKVSIQTENKQTISIAFDNVDFEGTLDVSNTQSGKTVTIAKLSQDMKTEIKNELSSMVKSMRDVVQNEKKGLFNGSDGEKVVSSMVSRLNQVSKSISENENEVTILQKLQSENNIVFRYKDSKFKGNIILTNELSYQIIASNIVNEVLSNIFTTKEGSVYTEEFKLAQTSETEGLFGNIGMIIGILIALTAIGFGGKYLISSTVSTRVKMILGVVGLILILIGILIAVFVENPWRISVPFIGAGAILLVVSIYLHYRKTSTPPIETILPI